VYAEREPIFLATPRTDSCWQTWHDSTVQRLHHRQTQSHGAEGWKDASEDNKWMIVQCPPFYKSLNLRNIDKSVSDNRIRIRSRSKAVFGYPYPVQTHYPAGYPTGKPDSDLLWHVRCLTKVGPDPDYRSRLQQDSAFFFQTRIRNRSQKFVKNRTRIRSNFSISAVAGVCVVIS